MSSNNGQLVEIFSLVKNHQFVIYRSKSLVQPPIGKLTTQAPQKIFQNISFWINQIGFRALTATIEMPLYLNRLSHIDLPPVVSAIAIRTLEDVGLEAALGVARVT